MSDLPYDSAEMASSGDVSPSVVEQDNTEMSYLDTEDNMHIIEQVPLNSATNDCITAMSLPCFSDDAPAACGRSYEENDSEMINLDLSNLDTSNNMPLMEQIPFKIATQDCTSSTLLTCFPDNGSTHCHALQIQWKYL